MTIKVISYDLGGPETSESYRRLIKAIEGIGDYIKPLESFFLVSTSLSCSEIRAKISSIIDHNDKLGVIETDQCLSAWQGVDPEIDSWIRRHRNNRYFF